MDNLDFLNLNSLRNYPIKDGVSRVSDDSLFVIPNTLIVDLSMCSAGGNTADNLSLYISRVVVNSTSLTIEISAGVGVFGTFQSALPIASTSYNTDVFMVPNATLFPYATGVMTLGSSDDLAGLPYGDFTFSSANTALLMRTYSPSNGGVNWMSFSDTKGNINTVTGFVKIQGHSNIQFTKPGDYVIMDAGENLGLNKICTNAGTCITSINGVGPDPTTGNFQLVPGTCVELTGIQYGQTISDPCGQACLGCSEVEALTTQVNGLESSILSINTFAENLGAIIQQATDSMNTPCQC